MNFSSISIYFVFLINVILPGLLSDHFLPSFHFHPFDYYARILQVVGEHGQLNLSSLYLLSIAVIRF